MKTRTRIVTRMEHPNVLGTNPQQILQKGSREVSLPDKIRVFMVRKVFYDDSMTPMYANPIQTIEKKYNSMRAILDEGKYSELLLLPILDLDHSLKTYYDEVSPQR